jgi:hypothetical protein
MFLQTVYVMRGFLVLAGAQKYQCACLNRLDAFLLCHLCEFIVFCSGVENDPFRMQVHYIIVVLLLIARVQV